MNFALDAFVDIHDTMELQQDNQEYYANINPELAQRKTRCLPSSAEVAVRRSFRRFLQENESIRWDGIEFFQVPSASGSVLDNVTEGAVEDADSMRWQRPTIHRRGECTRTSRQP